MQALKDGVRDKVQLATKFGIRMDGEIRVVQGDPEYVRACCEASLKRLEIDFIDLYYQHRIDSQVPIEVTVCQYKFVMSQISCPIIKLSAEIYSYCISLFIFKIISPQFDYLKKNLIREKYIEFIVLIKSIYKSSLVCSWKWMQGTYQCNRKNMLHY